MKEYFVLQYKMLNRNIKDLGFSPLIAYPLIAISFVLLSKYLFIKTGFASYIYTFLALSVISRLNELKRNDFLKYIFSSQNYLIIRTVENFIVSLPFLIFLVYEMQFLFAFILAFLTIIIALFNVSISTSSTIPTPFGKKPYEFTVGFRNTFFVFPFAYFLTFMSIYVGNFNLGVASLVLVGFVCISYYTKPENEYFVWNFSLSSQKFLFEKIKISFIYFSLLILPTLIGLSIFFIENILILIGIFVLNLIYLTTIILAKYSAYPNEMSLPQGILIFSSIIFPPILIGVIPYLYLESVKNLKSILND